MASPIAKAPYPCFTKRWHNTTYPALNPQGRALGKTVVITGASGGIGRATAIAFAQAGAKKIALLGRRQDKLSETKDAVSAVSKDVDVTTHVCDSTDLKALETAANEVGAWDVLILNAGVAPKQMRPGNSAELDLSTWWSGFETNVLGGVTTTKAFLSTANFDTRPTIIITSALLPFVPESLPDWASHSSYNASKVALLSFAESLAKDREDINVVSVQPGVIQTDIYFGTPEQAAWMKSVGMLDEVELPAGFFVWVSSNAEEKKWLSGKFMAANWDVEEFEQRKDEFAGYLRPLGWPWNV